MSGEEQDKRTEEEKDKENKCYADKYISLRAKLFDALNIHHDIGDKMMEEKVLKILQEVEGYKLRIEELEKQIKEYMIAGLKVSNEITTENDRLKEELETAQHDSYGLALQNKKLEEDLKACNKWGEEWKQHYDKVLSQLSAMREKVSVGKIADIIFKERVSSGDWTRESVAQKLVEYFK